MLKKRRFADQSTLGTNLIIEFSDDRHFDFNKPLEITAMLKLLKSVSMMLFLMGLSTGAAYAVSNTGTDDVRITQQSATCTGVVTDSTGETVIGASVVA